MPSTRPSSRQNPKLIAEEDCAFIALLRPACAEKWNVPTDMTLEQVGEQHHHRHAQSRTNGNISEPPACLGSTASTLYDR